MTPPVACSLRVAAYPPRGAMPAARQSRFRGIPGWGLWRAAGLALLGFASLCSLPSFAATKITIAVVSLDGDPRYAPRRMEKAYPGHPTGRAADRGQPGRGGSGLWVGAGRARAGGGG